MSLSHKDHVCVLLGGTVAVVGYAEICVSTKFDSSAVYSLCFSVRPFTSIYLVLLICLSRISLHLSVWAGHLPWCVLCLPFYNIMDALLEDISLSIFACCSWRRSPMWWAKPRPPKEKSRCYQCMCVMCNCDESMTCVRLLWVAYQCWSQTHQEITVLPFYGVMLGFRDVYPQNCHLICRCGWIGSCSTTRPPSWRWVWSWPSWCRMCCIWTPPSGLIVPLCFSSLVQTSPFDPHSTYSA